jgi:CRISPR type I-E-associated protein CasB/Cse2
MSTDITPAPAVLPATDPRPQRSGPDAGYTDWLLTARQHPTTRSALRRADIDATADRAYRYLARFWNGTPWLRQPILLHAATTATHLNSPQRAGASVGAVAASLVQAGVMSSNTLAARLLAVQRMDLRVAHRHMAGILHAAAAQAMAVDWVDLYTVYRNWDHTNIDFRRRQRRVLLEQFHARIPL